MTSTPDALGHAARRVVDARSKSMAKNAHNGLFFGALRLIVPNLPPKAQLARVEPLEVDLAAYRSRWRSAAEQMEAGG
jgi:hypothetical protein